MSNFRARESHVAQQSRRDKLRIQQSSAPAAAHHVEGFPNNLEQFWVHPELNPDVIHARRNAKLLYDSTLLSNSNIIEAPKDASMVHQDSGDRQIRAEDAFFANSSYPISSTADQPQQSCDWINVSNASGSANQNHMFVGEVLSSSCIKLNNINSASTPPSGNYNGFQDASSEISSQDSQKHYFNSPSVYQNTLQEVVTPASAANVILHHNTSTTRETGRASCPLGANELVFLPAYGSDHSNSLRPSNASASACAWINRPVSIDACHQWSGELGFLANKSDGDHLGNAQGLSLSLSSKPQPEIHVAQYGSEAVHSKTSTPVFNIPQDSKTLKSGYVYSNLKPSIGSPKGYGSSLQDIVGTSVYAHRNLGPLGPFTGYAAILKTSKFLKPAQQLLDEFCTLTSPKFLKNCDTSTDRISGEVCVSVDAVNAPEAEIGSNGGINSGASSSTFRSSNEFSGEGALLGSSSSESHPPEYQQKKAKLLYMQDEVCRRYKQYHQQMHMVVSSFESVAGLSAAAPYISLALKTVSRHFRCLKNAISDQLRNISKALGEDLSSPTTGASSSKGDIAMSRLKFLNQSFQKHKSSVGNMGFLESQQHIWRPQRGLPERAVAVLRAWLFEHFLHPYPTDTDKHMLATQTGLTRNQVSNWFINARVRVWKPMVEEIHMLETKGLAETDLKSGKNDGKAGSEVGDRPNGNQPSNKVSVNAVAEKRLECCGMGSLDRPSAQEWNQEKHSRLEGQIPASMDGSLMGFMPYQRNIGLEVGGLGAVSLTLGLRHGAETAQQQQQQENLLRQHFGGHMIHDFVG